MAAACSSALNAIRYQYINTSSAGTHTLPSTSLLVLCSPGLSGTGLAAAAMLH